MCVCVCVCREEAELEYLKVAQDLEMYGVNYFEIKVGLSFNTPQPTQHRQSTDAT